MYRTSKALLAAEKAKAAAAAALIKSYQAENLPANRDKVLPAGGAWLIGGSANTPGVNAAFGFGISQTDLDNLRAGKTLYKFSPARLVGAGMNHHVHVPGHWVHASAYVAPLVNDYFRNNRQASLFQINQFSSETEQQFQQGQNRNFNQGALVAIATFATAGYLGAANIAGGAGAAPAAGAVPAVDTTLPGLSAQELATTQAANLTAAGLAPLSPAELAATTAANVAASSGGVTLTDIAGYASSASTAIKGAGVVNSLLHQPPAKVEAPVPVAAASSKPGLSVKEIALAVLGLFGLIVFI